MSRRTNRLQVESLEERSVPSTTAGLASPIVEPIAIVGPMIPVAIHQIHDLAGQGQGTFTSSPLMVDAGETFHLTGSGHFGKLGEASVTGTLHGVGMIASGRAEGTLTFTNEKGSVTIALEGPIQTGFAQMPTWYSYHVISATGSYKNLRDHGTVRIDFHAIPIAVDPPVAGHTATPALVPIFEILGHFHIAI